jgi:transglutaminase-like putative cysteine protease
MLYKATHTTRYLYDATVSQCQSEVRLTPRTLPWQTLVESSIQTTPLPASVDTHEDYFGNTVNTFTILDSHDRFSTVATSLVEVRPREASPGSVIAWDDATVEIAAHAAFDTLEAFEFVFDWRSMRAPAFRRGARLSRRSRISHTASTPTLPTRQRPRVSIHRCLTYSNSRGACARTLPT